MEKMQIRIAAPEDAAALAAIYAPYVLHTAITFEYEPPSEAEFRDRIEKTLQTYPYYVALLDGKIVGYAYAGEIGERAAYDWSAESSIYITEDVHRMGIGRRLYGALELALREMGITNLYAVVAWPPEEDDPYLTGNSAAFHEHIGYRTVAHLHRCGHKFGRWYDVLWMEKTIGAYAAAPEAIRPFCEIADAVKPGEAKD